MRCFTVSFWLLTGLLLLGPAPGRAEVHHATVLGNPAGRFAPPLRTPEDLRARFRDPALKPDIAAILAQWRWTGNVEDLHRAAASAEIHEWKIPVGSTMPFMSSRHNGDPVCLRNVIWEGAEPAPAYEFVFTSRGQRYRCITPKACSNFFVVDLGPEPKPELALDCTAPAEVPMGRPAKLCLTLRNTGAAAEPKVTVTLPLAPGVVTVAATEGGQFTNGTVVWTVLNLESNSTKELCANLGTRQIGTLPFLATANGTLTKPVSSSCETKVVGLPAVLLEVVDLDDPIEVGKDVTYEIKVTNQGTASDTKLRLVCTLDAAQEFVSGRGATEVHAEGKVITTDPLPALAPKAVAIWRIIVKAREAADARFKVELYSEQLDRPITEDEATRQY